MEQKLLDVTSYGTDYKSKYVAIKAYLDTQQLDSLASILDELRTELDMIEANNFPSDQKTYFLNEALPFLVKSLMNRHHTIQNYQAGLRKINIFLCHWLFLRLKCLATDKCEGDAIVLHRIFSGWKKYYEIKNVTFFTYAFESELYEDFKASGHFKEEPADSPWKLLAINKLEFPNQSLLFLANMFYFAKLGGFEACKAVFESDLIPKNTAFAYKILKALANMRDSMTMEQWQGSALPVGIAAIHTGQRLIAEWDMKSVKQKYFVKYIKCVQKLVKDGHRNLADSLQVALAAKMLTSPALELRISAIREVLSIIGRLPQKWPGNNEDKNAVARALAVELKNARVLDHILAETNHHKELLNPCIEQDLFGFMYAWETLGKSHLDAMWERTLEGDSEGYFLRALESVIMHFSATDAREAFDKVKSIPLDKYTETIVKTLVALAKNEAVRQEHNKLKNALDESFGVLHYIFSLTHNEAIVRGLPKTVQDLALNEFTSLLVNYGSKASKDLRVEYAITCEDMLGKDLSPLQMAQLYSKLATALLSTRAKLPKTVPELFQKVAMNILRVKVLVVQKAVETIPAEDKSKSADICEELYGQLVTNRALNLTYYQDLAARLDILSALVDIGTHIIRPETIKILCEGLINNNLSRTEREIFFGFMQKITRHDCIEKLMSRKCLDPFLYDILLRINPRSYTLPMLDCLKNIVLSINGRYGKIKYEKGLVEVSSMKLIGLQYFWDLALIPEDCEVRKVTSEFLLDLYKHLKPELIEKEGNALKEKYIKESIKRIQEAITATKDNREEKCKIACRAIDFLSRCINTLETTESKIAPLSGSVPFINVVITSASGMDFREFNVDPATTLTGLLKQIDPNFAFYGTSFISNIGVLKPSEKSLRDLGVPPSLEIVVEKVGETGHYALGSDNPDDGPRSISALKNVAPGLKEQVYALALLRARGGGIEQAISILTEETSLYEIEREVVKIEESRMKRTHNERSEKMSTLLAKNPEYFGSLYAAMSLPALSTKIWELINNLPLSEAVINELVNKVLMSTAQKVPIEWERLFPPNDLYKLAYSVKVLAKIFTVSPFIDCKALSNEIPTFKNVKSLQWTDAFIQGGGIEYICYLLSKLSQKEHIEKSALTDNSKIAMQMLEILIEIIKGVGIHSYLNSESPLTLAYMKQTGDYAEAENSQEKMKIRTEISEASLGQILGTLKSIRIVSTLVGMLGRISTSSITNNMLASIFALIGTALCSDPEYYDQLYENDAFAEYLAGTLKESPNYEQKRIIMKYLSAVLKTSSIQKFPEEIQRPNMYFFNTLASMIPPPTEHSPNSEHYFEFFQEVFDVYTQGLSCDVTILLIGNEVQDQPVYSPVELFKLLLEYTLERLEQEELPTKNDRQLVGYLKSILTLQKMNLAGIPELLKMETEQLLKLSEKISNEIFGHMRGTPYKSKPSQRRKCAHKPALTFALNFLLTVAFYNPMCRAQALLRISEFNREQLKTASKETGYEGGLVEEDNGRPRRYVGLKNFGATCFVNAMLQQLFMMPEFRYQILSISPEKVPTENCDKVVYNLQKIFGYQLLSDQQYYIPDHLYKDLKWFDGRTIDVKQQHDTDEFFNLITDKLATELKGTACEKLLNETMETILTDQVESLELDKPYSSERDEPCFKISLDIKGKKTIEEALDAFVKGDVLEGDNKLYCPEYDKKIRVNKRFVIKSLAPTLIIHLKRFEFNYQAMIKEKVNDYCAFPNKINMLKWTKEAPAYPDQVVENKEKYEYELVGVLVHSGTADAGHYISIIKERDKASPNYDKWFEFNDTLVTPFNIESMPTMCFGKEKAESQFTAYPNDLAWAITNPTAYLLVYQRVGYSKDYEQVTVPELLRSAIEQDNLANANIKIYCDGNYAEFVHSFYKLWESVQAPTFLASESATEIEESSSIDDPYILSCEVAFKYALDHVVKTREYKKYKEFVKTLIKHVETNAVFALWVVKFMTKNKAMLFEHLIEQRLESARQDTVTLLSTAINTVLATELPYLVTREITSNTTYRSSVLRFISMLTTEGMEVARINWRRPGGLFELLQAFSLRGFEERKLLLDFNMIAKTIDYVSNTVLPLFGELKERPKMDENYNKLKEPVEVLFTLIKTCVTTQMVKLGKTPDGDLPEKYLMLPVEEVDLLFSDKWNFMSLSIHNAKRLSQILTHLFWENPELSLKVIPVITAYTVANRGSDHYKAPLEVLKETIKLQDKHIVSRFKVAFFETPVSGHGNFFDLLKEYQANLQVFVLDTLCLLGEMVVLEGIKEMMYEKLKDKLLWVPTFINTRPGDFKMFSFNLWTNNEAQQKREFVTTRLINAFDLRNLRSSSEAKREYESMEDINRKSVEQEVTKGEVLMERALEAEVAEIPAHTSDKSKEMSDIKEVISAKPKDIKENDDRSE